MLDRRGFLGSIALPSAAALAAFARSVDASESGFDREAWQDSLNEWADRATDGSPMQVAADEDFWRVPQQAFAIDRSMINLNNGGISPSPRVVLEAMRRFSDHANTAPAYVLWKLQEPQRESVREAVANHWGVSAEEIAFTRNASESLQICQLGLDLKAGDEVVTTTQDYPRMLATFRQMERRNGIKLVLIKLPIPCENDAEVVSRLEAAITPRARMILISHVINITGQIMPVNMIAAMARGKNGGIPVVVDGAHAFAHLNFKLADLGCDYYGVSLHKWLFAPHGTGLLYVRRDKIKGLWPMMAAKPEQDEDIRKFEEIGTHPAGPALAIADALAFHQTIGDARKEARMRYLRNYWAERLADTSEGAAHPVVFHTSLDPRFSCGIATFQLRGLESGKIASELWERHKILVNAISHDEFEGIRVTPSIYTLTSELDRFVGAVRQIMKDGLAA
ncbi:MAG: aminotransferase class V-fold PLP-dependent enzyme [Planctomycetes bacterium]|nr:aminotransferase class V-fold PLP-dependent enzyme [Planctomycetota bacterium]